MKTLQHRRDKHEDDYIMLVEGERALDFHKVTPDHPMVKKYVDTHFDEIENWEYEKSDGSWPTPYSPIFAYPEIISIKYSQQPSVYINYLQIDRDSTTLGETCWVKTYEDVLRSCEHEMWNREFYQNKTLEYKITVTLPQPRITVEQMMECMGIKKLSEEELTKISEQVISENPDVVKQIKDGNEKAIGALIGKAKKIDDNVVPKKFKEVCLNLIKPKNNDPHNQAWLHNAECSKCGRVYCDCETKY